MTVPPTQPAEAARRPHVAPPQPCRFDSDATLDPVEHVGDAPKKQLQQNARAARRVLPPWAKDEINRCGERVHLPEWDEDEALDEDGDSDGCTEGEVDEEYRSRNGWKGSDLCHSVHSPVRISHYRIHYPSSENEGGGVGTTLTGLVHFTPRAESHAGHCHGGSMTSVMDDVVGWTAFHVTGECVPWSGFTAQVNVSLKRPIAVGSYLKVVGKVARWEGRKVWIHSELIAGETEEREEVVHCAAEGLVILKRDA